MPKGKACLTCKHVKFIVPDDWKPGYQGEKYDRFDTVRVIRETKFHVKAKCTFNPAWITVATSHYCGQWDGRGSEKDVEEFIWGSSLERSYNELRGEVVKLKASLKQARRISKSRLDRLKSNGATRREVDQ